MQKVTPFLWFNTEAMEAVKFYSSIFTDSEILKITYYGEGTPAPPGSVLTIHFKLAGQEYIALNGGPKYSFSPAFSLVIACDSQEEIDHFWYKLSKGGEEEACGWLMDKFGFHWQVVPSEMGKLISGDGNTERAQCVMNAMFGMKKLDLAELERAFNSVKD